LISLSEHITQREPVIPKSLGEQIVEEIEKDFEKGLLMIKGLT